MAHDVGLGYVNVTLSKFMYHFFTVCGGFVVQ